MIHFFDKAKGYTVASPETSLSFGVADSQTLSMALAIAGLSELPADDLLARCRRVLLVPHPETKSVFTKSKLKDNVRKLYDLCEQVGRGVVAWE